MLRSQGLDNLSSGDSGAYLIVFESHTILDVGFCGISAAERRDAAVELAIQTRGSCTPSTAGRQGKGKGRKTGECISRIRNQCFLSGTLSTAEE